MQKKTLKEIYQIPLTTVFEVRQEGVICASQLQRYEGEEW